MQHYLVRQYVYRRLDVEYVNNYYRGIVVAIHYGASV